jgi:hypothetical protein
MLGILRDATEPMSTPDMACAVMRLAGDEYTAFLTILARVRSGLGYLMRGGKCRRSALGALASHRQA